jgi:hypothetical protein
VSNVRDLTGRCGSCAFFVPLFAHAPEGALRRGPTLAADPASGTSGECRLGCWPAPLRDSATCASHQPIGARPSPTATRGARQARATSLQSRGDTRAQTFTRPARSPLPREVGIDMDQDEFRAVLREILLDELGVRDTELGDRWQNGELVLVPGKAGTQEKRIPIDSLFRKVVLIREKLRVLEQKINSHDKLDDNDRVQLQQYVTQCYGSLTTFNVLFKHKDDQFAGSAKDD